jgi:hypothetical protein
MRYPQKVDDVVVKPEAIDGLNFAIEVIWTNSFYGIHYLRCSGPSEYEQLVQKQTPKYNSSERVDY